ncbi:MAG: hypothetical protein QOD49_1039 [Actinomycetota bacterium]|nr:hypothetical protein [Actinomycetota bacterium]
MPEDCVKKSRRRSFWRNLRSRCRRAGRVKRPWVLLGVLAVLIVAGAVLAGPSGSDDCGPHGTLALRRCLEAMGGTVRTADTPPDGPAVFVLLNDSGLTPNGKLVPTPACHQISSA